MRIIDNITEDEFKEIVLSSNKISEVTAKIGYKPSRKSDGLVSKRIKDLGISTKHFSNWNSLASVPTVDLLIYGSARDNQTIKKRIIKENIIPYACLGCGNTGE